MIFCSNSERIRSICPRHQTLCGRADKKRNIAPQTIPNMSSEDSHPSHAYTSPKSYLYIIACDYAGTGTAMNFAIEGTPAAFMANSM